MASPVEAILLLCDAATVDSLNKVHMLGAGWSVTTSPTSLSAVVGMTKVPWDRTNEKLELKLELTDADGTAVTLEGQPVGIEQLVEVGRPPGLVAGTPIDFNFSFSVPSMPLVPGRYSWRLNMAGTLFQTSFTVLSAPPAVTTQ